MSAIRMQAQTIASLIVDALEADKPHGYDLEAGMFGPGMTALLDRLGELTLKAYASESRTKEMIDAGTVSRDNTRRGTLRFGVDSQFSKTLKRGEVVRLYADSAQPHRVNSKEPAIVAGEITSYDKMDESSQQALDRHLEAQRRTFSTRTFKPPYVKPGVDCVHCGEKHDIWTECKPKEPK